MGHSGSHSFKLASRYCMIKYVFSLSKEFHWILTVNGSGMMIPAGDPDHCSSGPVILLKLWPPSKYYVCIYIIYIVTDTQLEPHFFQNFHSSQLEPQKTSTVGTLLMPKVLTVGVTATNYENRIIFQHASNLVISIWPLCCGNACKL